MFSNPWLDFSYEQVRPLKLGSFSTVAVHKDDLSFLSKPPANCEWEDPPPQVLPNISSSFRDCTMAKTLVELTRGSAS